MRTNRVAFQSLFEKFRPDSNRSESAGPRGRARSSGLCAHCVRKACLHFGHSIFGSIRFCTVCSIRASQCGHWNSTGIRTSCVSVAMLTIPNRRASAPSASITSSGSTPLPLLLLIVSP